MADFNIYVASLSDYNNGRLHGAWIECDGKSADELQQEVNVMLRGSKHPNVQRQQCLRCDHIQDTLRNQVTSDDNNCDVCGSILSHFFASAEEWAIHDYEGFPPEFIGEYSRLEQVVSVMEILETVDDVEALAAFANHYGYADIEQAGERFEDAYCGQWDSERAYADDFVDQCGYLDEMPEHLRHYFDYEAFARDLFLDGYAFVDGYVFNDYH